MLISLDFNENLLNQMNSLTCLIETPAGKGTCNIIEQIDEMGHLILITAKHCILGKDSDKNIDLPNTHIHIPNKESYIELTLNDCDQILIPDDNIDAAIIIISTKSHNNQLDNRIIPKKLLQSFTTLPCKFRGYPQSMGDLNPQTIAVEFEDFNQLKTGTPLSSLKYADPVYNCNGFSGSGVYMAVDQKLYLIGIIYSLEEPFSYFKMQNLSFANELLVANHYQKLSLNNLPENPSILKDIKTLNDMSHKFSIRLKRTIGKTYQIKREAIRSDIIKNITNMNTTIITGLPGTGKTIETLNSFNELRSKDYQILTIKAELFAVNTERDFFPTIENNFEDIFAYILLNKKIVVLIDGFEKFLDIVNDDYLINFLTVCKIHKNIILCFTCRSFALSEILFNYLSYLKSPATVGIPLLSNKEIDPISETYPKIKQLLFNLSISKLLKRPFYLDIIIRYIDLLSDSEDINEKKVLFLIWDKVITKNNMERGQIFEKICYQRAKEMKPFVKIEACDSNIIEELYRDELIIKDDTFKEYYSPAHDVYEDIALIRIIERTYLGLKDNNRVFFQTLGKEPAIRRGFRLWLNLSLNNVDYNLNEFVGTILSTKETENYWKDEILISILKSDYCSVFFNENEEMILSDNDSLLIKFIVLLKIACIDVTFTNDNKILKAGESQKKKLFPFGNGWKTVIEFISSKLNELDKHNEKIVRFLVFYWKKRIINVCELPEESSSVFEIILNFISLNKLIYEISYQNYSVKTLVDYCIDLIFQLTEIDSSEIRKLLEEADRNQKNTKIDSNLRYFSMTVIEKALDFNQNEKLCKYLPNEIYSIAINNWITDQGAKHNYSSDGIEHEFGLINHYHLRISPSSPLKTPLIHLLDYNTKIGLKLVVNIINHCTDKYLISDRCINPLEINSFIGESVDKSYNYKIPKKHKIIVDSKEYIIKGNSVLWCMYRGTNETTPYLLQSLLMALEKWLMKIAKSNDAESSKKLAMSFDYILKNSTSVATTSVLVSIALAYPETIGLLIFPVLRVKEFYYYDIERMIHDKQPHAFRDLMNPEIQKEKIESNNLEHRKNYLEQLVTKLQTCGFYDEISKLLDTLFEEVDQEDKTWPLMISRMDIRNFEIDKIVKAGEKQYVSLKVSYPTKLQHIINENEKELDKYNIISSISSWCYKVINDPNDENNTFINWNNCYNLYINSNTDFDGVTAILSDPALLALIGMRYHDKSLNENQRSWCFDLITNAVFTQINNQNSISSMLNIGSIYIDKLLNILPDILLSKISVINKNIVKKLIFLSLTEFDTHHKDTIIKSVRDNLWNIDEDFAMSCFGGLIEHSIVQMRYRSQEIPTIEKQNIISNVVSNNVTYDMDNISFLTHSIWDLITAIQIIPYDTNITILRDYFKTYLQLLLSQYNEQKPNQYYDFYDPFYNSLVHFLLNHDIEISSQFIDCLLLFKPEVTTNHSYSLVEFQKEFINHFFTVFDITRSDQFWIVLEYFSNNINRFSQKSILLKLIFLNMPNVNLECIDWEPLRIKKMFFQKQIIKWGSLDLNSVSKLLSGLGATSFLPDGINWFMDILRKTENPLKELMKESTFYYCEKIVDNIFCKHFVLVRQNVYLKKNMLQMLDLLIMFESSIAYHIRERLISI